MPVFNNVPEDKNVKLQLVYYFRDVNFFVSSSWFGKQQVFVEPSVDNYDFSGDQFTNVDMILINRVVLGAVRMKGRKENAKRKSVQKSQKK